MAHRMPRIFHVVYHFAAAAADRRSRSRALWGPVRANIAMPDLIRFYFVFAGQTPPALRRRFARRTSAHTATSE